MEDALGDKVRTFVDFWIQSHIRAEGYQAEGDTRLAGALARKCVEMAQTEAYQLAISKLSSVISSSTFTGRSNA
jgi:hypothetical protein